MTQDFRADQIQQKQLVITGSDALIVYPISKQSTDAPNQGIVDATFPTGSIGADVLLFVSGAVSGKNAAARTIVAFGGDVHISGNITADGTGLGVGDGTDWTSNGTELKTTSSVSIDSENGYASAQGSDVYFHVSGGIGVDVSVFGGDVQISGTLYTDGTNNILMPRIAGSTFNSVEHLQNVFHSPGYVSGGEITTGSTGLIDVAAGTGLIRATSGPTDQILWFDFPASASLVLASGSANFVGVEYNAGTPRVAVHTTEDWNLQTEFPLGVAVYEPSNKVHIEFNPQAVGDHALQMIRRNYETMPLARDERLGGIILGDGDRNASVTAGALWDRLNRFTIGAKDTSVSDTMSEFYMDGSGSWTLITGSTEWNNSQYDDGTGTLATLANNRYTNRWFYIDADDDDLSYVFGQAEYPSIAGAEAESPPSSVPLRLEHMGKLIGRMIIQQGSAGPPEQVQSVFTTTFAATAASDHGNLAGLSDDDHTQYALVDGTRAFTGTIKVAAGSQSIPGYGFPTSGLGFFDNGGAIRVTLASGGKYQFSTTYFGPLATDTYTLGHDSLRWKVVNVGPGTSALPSISVGAAESGLFEPTTGDVAVSANEITVATFDTTGNLSYGTAVSASKELSHYTSATTGSEAVAVATYALSGNRLYKFDFSIMAVGTGSGITKTMERKLSVAAFGAPFILTDTIFIPTPDVTGSAAATMSTDIQIVGTDLIVYCSGTVSQSVSWLVDASIVKHNN